MLLLDQETFVFKLDSARVVVSGISPVERAGLGQVFAQALSDAVHNGENLSVVNERCGVVNMHADINGLKDLRFRIVKLFELSKNCLNGIVHNIAVFISVGTTLGFACEMFAKMVNSHACIHSACGAHCVRRLHVISC